MRDFEVGWELEFSRPDYTQASDYLESYGEVKYDGTVPDGFELASHVTTTNNFTNPVKLNNWVKLFEILDRLNVDTESPLGAGMHIHCSREVFNDPWRIYALNAFLIKFDTFTQTVGGRDFGQYCKAVLNTIEQIRFPQILKPIERRRVLNVRKGTTIEYRFFKTTKNYHRFIANMQFAISTTNFALDDNFSKKDCEITNSPVLYNFCKYLYQNKDRYEVLLDFLNSRGLLVNKNSVVDPVKKGSHVLNLGQMPHLLRQRLRDVIILPILEQDIPNFPFVPLLKLAQSMRSLNYFKDAELIKYLNQEFNKAVRKGASTIEIRNA